MDYIAEVVAEVYKARKGIEIDGETQYVFDMDMAVDKVKTYFDGWFGEIDTQELYEYQQQMMEEYNNYVDHVMAVDKEWNDVDMFSQTWKNFIQAKELYKFLDECNKQGDVWKVCPKKFIKGCFHGDESV